jgi:HSP20 family protein
MSLFSSLIRSNAPQASETETFLRPRHEIEETDSAYGLTVFLPGVAKSGLEITDEASELRIIGRRESKLPKDAVALHRESAGASFELVLAHDATVDTSKIVAELTDGVLRLSLPKAESARPRKIAVS